MLVTTPPEVLMVALRTGLDEDAIAVKLERAQLRVGVVVGATQVCGDLGSCQLLAVADLFWRGVYLRDAGEEMARSQPVIHDVFVMNVVVAEDRYANDRASKQQDKERQQDSIAEGAVRTAACAAVFEFDWQNALSF